MAYVKLTKSLPPNLMERFPVAAAMQTLEVLVDLVSGSIFVMSRADQAYVHRQDGWIQAAKYVQAYRTRKYGAQYAQPVQHCPYGFVDDTIYDDDVE